MRYVLMLMGALLSICLFPNICLADEGAGQELPAFSKKLTELSWISKSKPNTNARVFFVLHIISNNMECKDCIAMVPEVWHLMRGRGADIVIVGRDKDTENIKAIVEDNPELPPVLDPACRKSIPLTYEGTVSGCEFPYLEIFSADGKKLGQAAYARCLDSMKNWEKHVQPTYEEKLAADIRILEEDMYGRRRLEITKKYTEANYIGSARPHKASLVFYRMFTCTAKINPFVTSKPVLDLYKKMKGHGAEIILVCNGGTEKDVLQLIKRYKIPYPVIHVPSEKAAALIASRPLYMTVDFGESQQRMPRELAVPMTQLEHWEKFVKQLRDEKKQLKQLKKKLKEYRKKNRADKVKADKA